MEPIMNLGRIGHYFVPMGGEGASLTGSCQTSIVSGVIEPVGETDPWLVNLGVWQHAGNTFDRTNVPVAATPVATGHSFHLNQSCPWGR